MSLKDQILGPNNPQAGVAAALKAVEAAQAALDAAYVSLLSIARAVVSEPVRTAVEGQCVHPREALIQAGSFGGVQVLCGVCGESVPE